MNIKKLSLVGLVLAGVASLALLTPAGRAVAQTATSYAYTANHKQFDVPIAINSVADVFGFWSPRYVAYAEATASAVQAYTGAGVLERVCVSSGVAGHFAMAFDSATTLGITTGTTGKSLAYQQTNPTTSGSNSPDAGCVYPNMPFTNGLVLLNSNNDTYTVVRYRKK